MHERHLDPSRFPRGGRTAGVAAGRPVGGAFGHQFPWAHPDRAVALAFPAECVPLARLVHQAKSGSNLALERSELASPRAAAYQKSMQVPLVLTVIGRDRPGLVEKVASVVASHGGNWLESRMCRLGGQFAGIVRIQIPGHRQSALRAGCQSLAREGLTVEAFGDELHSATPPRCLAIVELVGQDRPGIVHQISGALASRGVNVEELTTECLSAPMSGETLFKAIARLRLPEDCDTAGLRADLERIAADLLVDLTFEPLEHSPGGKTVAPAQPIA